MGGGKGGIGKTMMSANLGVALAQAGHKVLLVDADLGGANLHTALGIAAPAKTLSDFVHRQSATLEEVIVPTSVPNLSLIAGASDVLDAANLKFAQKQKLVRNLHTQATDYLLMDLGAGTSFSTLDLFVIADYGLLVLLPEPTSVENAYRFVKAAFYRRLQSAGAELGIEELTDRAMNTPAGVLRTPHDFVSEVMRLNPEAGARIARELATFRIRIIVNQTRLPADQGVGAAVVSAWKKFFGLEMHDLGAVPYDDAAWQAVRKRRPVLLERPESEVARSIQRIADRILALDGFPRAPPP